MIETFGTETVDVENINAAVNKLVDLRPGAIIKKFDLRKPIYKDLAAYGHMGREELSVKWEECDIADKLRSLCL
jgi:S-adenosylmethionine synthetase